MIRTLVAVLLCLALAVPAWAVNPDEVLDDPALEERARDLSAELRCLVCQNESIDDSQADMARDLRLLVRERLVAGDTNTEVLAYVTDRYGAFVRLRPPLNASTVILWVMPFVFGLVAFASCAVYLRSRKTVAAAEGGPDLSAEERAELERILAQRKES
jgi:cytochrome c-type biogenesis protein CcmH